MSKEKAQLIMEHLEGLRYTGTLLWEGDSVLWMDGTIFECRQAADVRFGVGRYTEEFYVPEDPYGM
ncbi:hypothetical protein NVP1121O_219 [Vibrio phage 1.121.O._10N.286.46.C4]|nr:hypothetical protein NVP1121O_219 [Vibrio phage 1.121.O._10N.286.46.C4]